MLFQKELFMFFFAFQENPYTFSKKTLKQDSLPVELPPPSAPWTLAGNNRKQMSLPSAALGPLTGHFSEVNLLIIYLLHLEMADGKDR